MARIGGYTVAGSLGRGGFGEVYAARHDVLGREVAIKVLHAKWCHDEEAVRRFVAEARAVNAVRHPHIVDVIDFGTLDDARQYYVMERLHGETLRARLEARGRLPLDEVVAILRPIAVALDAAHDAGVVHRDVKPENVFLHITEAGEVPKLIDFGLAKLDVRDAGAPTQSGVILGTPAYMAPEQCRGVAVDGRCDAYAFGVIAYELLTGTVPHRGDDPIATLLAHVNDDVTPASRRCAEVPAHVDRILLSLLAKTPAERPARILDAIVALAAPPSRPRRARWVLAGALAAAAAGAVTVVALTDRGADAAAPSPSPAVAAMPDAGGDPLVVPEVRGSSDAAAPVAPPVAPPPAAHRHSSSPRQPDPEDPEDPYAP